jgi:hypothetical protein
MIVVQRRLALTAGKDESMRLVVMIAVVQIGCVIGGAPVIGVNRKGVFYGGELVLGTPIVQQASGLDSTGTSYLRGDVSYDFVRSCAYTADGARLAGRLGFGWTFDEHAFQQGMWKTGTTVAASGGRSWPTDDPPAGMTGWHFVVTAELGVRYVSGWEIVLLPRAELHQATTDDRGFNACKKP